MASTPSPQCRLTDKYDSVTTDESFVPPRVGTMLVVLCVLPLDGQGFAPSLELGSGMSLWGRWYIISNTIGHFWNGPMQDTQVQLMSAYHMSVDHVILIDITGPAPRLPGFGFRMINLLCNLVLIAVHHGNGNGSHFHMCNMFSPACINSEVVELHAPEQAKQSCAGTLLTRLHFVLLLKCLGGYHLDGSPTTNAQLPCFWKQLWLHLAASIADPQRCPNGD